MVMNVDLRRIVLRLVMGLWVVVVVLNGVGEEGANAENLVFDVKHKFGGRKNAYAYAYGNGNGNGGNSSLLTSLKAHDTKRHGRFLSVDLRMGGDGSPTDAALYFSKLSIGTPPNDYYVQVDTGSDILWINCAGCVKCPKKSTLGIKLTLYDIKSSSTGKTVTCDQEFCAATFNMQSMDCQTGMLCQYSITYGDGSTTAGYFVRDNIMLNQVSGNFQTTPMNGSVVFGCSSQQSGELGSSTEAVDGIIGFGQSNSSMISQLASSGKVKKIFSHCFDGINGGGIFAIGEVMQPKLNTTPIVPHEQHYNVILKAVAVGGKVVALPVDSYGGTAGSETIIDSGTTLAYLPDDLYAPLMEKIMAGQPNIQTHVVESQFKCFFYAGNIDDGFPVVTFQFEDSLYLSVYPHDYLFEVRDGEWCIGWQNKGLQTRDGREMTLLGDLVLSDKLVTYDLEKQTIGWVEYNCSSSIKVKDEISGNTYSVGAHVISSASRMHTLMLFPPLLLITIIYTLIC